jgi:hypothetical protein
MAIPRPCGALFQGRGGRETADQSAPEQTSESQVSVFFLGEGRKLVSGENWRYPTVTEARVDLFAGRREGWIYKVAHCDPDSCSTRPPFDCPVQGGATRCAEVIIGRVTGEWSDTINLESVVDPGFALGLDPLTGGEIGLNREHAASSLLAEITVAGADHDRFGLDGDLYPSTPALRRSLYQLLIPTVRSISPQVAVSVAMSSGQHIVSIRASNRRKNAVLDITPDRRREPRPRSRTRPQSVPL